MASIADLIQKVAASTAKVVGRPTGEAPEPIESEAERIRREREAKAGAGARRA